ncbi:MAG TPA: cupin domain-containing protein [Clostridia bacterium]|nr:cupin domain-containing protein [Clostridia bacterium]
MIVSHLKEVAGQELKGDNLSQVVKKVLVSPKEGWDGWVMRLFELGEKGYTPRHKHPWPHINYVSEGKGVLHLEGVDHPITEGSFAFVPSDVLHQFQNTGEGKLSFICIVPEEGDV